MLHRRFLYLLVSLLFFITFSFSVQAFEGKVVSIADGDTISVMHNGVAEKIRLNGVDCPESSQAYGNKAKQFSSDLVFGETVTVKDYGKDKYGRTIGDVFLSDGVCLNKLLVKFGYAWWYREYSTDTVLKQLEQNAKLLKKGLWADSNPVAPWDYRHNPTASASPTSNDVKAPSSVTLQMNANNQLDTIVYITQSGTKYHSAGCRYLKSSIPIKL